jgi:divalent metal cation (Fe/Co/Zn/Cd) transporter
VALAGFGLDSLIEIVASLVVIWHLRRVAVRQRERRALQVIGTAFLVLALYIAAQSIDVLLSRSHARPSTLGTVWLAATAVAMFALAAGKARTGRALGNRVLQTEARVTLVDGLLATAVLAGVVLDQAFGLWWCDPAAAFVIVYYGLREGRQALREARALADRPFEDRQRGPNQAVSASRSPESVPSPTQPTYPSGRMRTPAGAATGPRTGSSHSPS